MKDKVKTLSLFGGLGATLIMAWGNAVYAEETKVAAPVVPVNVEQQDAQQVNVSAEQARAKQIAAIEVPYGDSRKDKLTDLEWDGVAQVASGRSDGIVFLYSDSKGLAPEDDEVLQELKEAAQHLIADPEITFSGILAVDSSNGIDKLKIWIDGSDVASYGYKEGSVGIEAGRGGLRDVVLATSKEQWKAIKKIDSELEQISGTQTEKPAQPEK